VPFAGANAVPDNRERHHSRGSSEISLHSTIIFPPSTGNLLRDHYGVLCAVQSVGRIVKAIITNYTGYGVQMSPVAMRPDVSPNPAVESVKEPADMRSLVIIRPRHAVKRWRLNARATLRI
jgi:hypothetical protein